MIQTLRQSQKNSVIGGVNTFVLTIAAVQIGLTGYASYQGIFIKALDTGLQGGITKALAGASAAIVENWLHILDDHQRPVNLPIKLSAVTFTCGFFLGYDKTIITHLLSK